MNLYGLSSANTANVAENYSGTFQEAAEDSITLDRKFDILMMKLDAYTESVDRELAINIAKSELKCMTEGGTDDDMAYLEEAAEEGAIVKFKNMIAKVVAAIKEWFSQKKTKVIAKITSKEARDVLTKAEKKIKINPILAKKKVQITNVKRPLGVIHTYRSKNDKVIAKTVKGIVTESTMKTIASTKEDFRDEFRSSMSGTAALTTITVAGLVAALNSEIGKLPSYVDNMEKCTTDALERLKMTCSEEAAASAIAATNAAANFGAELAKEEVNVKIDSIMNMMSVLKSAVMKAKGLEPAPVVKPIKEEADDFETGSDEAFEEGAANREMRDEFEKAFTVYKAEMKALKASRKAAKFDDAIKHGKNAKKEMDDLVEKIQKIDDTVGDAVTGMLFQGLINCAKLLVVTAATFGLGTYFEQLRQSAASWASIYSDCKHSNEKLRHFFNTRRSEFISNAQTLSKYTELIIARIENDKKEVKSVKESADDLLGYLDDSFEESTGGLEDPFGFLENEFEESAEDPFAFDVDEFEESSNDDLLGLEDFEESTDDLFGLDDPFGDLNL
jgi:hypothetical protein